MKQKNHVQSFIQNVIIKEPHLNFVANLQISKMIISHQLLDQLKYHHKEELLYMKVQIIMERKSFLQKINHALKNLK